MEKPRQPEGQAKIPRQDANGGGSRNPPPRPTPSGPPRNGASASGSATREDRRVQPPAPNVGKGSCRVVEDRYRIVEGIGGGTYGDVFKAIDKEAPKQPAYVALKRLKFDAKNESEGMPITAIREIHILRQLNHENVVRLLEVAVANPTGADAGDIFMVLEYMEHDLTGLLENMGNRRLSRPEVKCIMKQLLTGLHFCHSHSVLHRDLKPANLLLSRDGVLKLTDYGLARILSSNQKRNYTNRVVTLWYRPPELLLGESKYSNEIDVWSVGCIFAEILSASSQPNVGAGKPPKQGKPIFSGENELQQMEYITYVMGAPTEETWPGVTSLPDYNTLVKHKTRQPCGLSQWLHKMGYVEQDKLAMDLLSKLLAMDPKKRISALEALKHDYFWNDPLPAKPEDMPKVQASMSEEALAKRTAKHKQQHQQNQKQQQQGAQQQQPKQQHQQNNPQHQQPHQGGQRRDHHPPGHRGGREGGSQQGGGGAHRGQGGGGGRHHGPQGGDRQGGGGGGYVPPPRDHHGPDPKRRRGSAHGDDGGGGYSHAMPPPPLPYNGAGGYGPGGGPAGGGWQGGHHGAGAPGVPRHPYHHQGGGGGADGLSSRPPGGGTHVGTIDLGPIAKPPEPSNAPPPSWLSARR